MVGVFELLVEEWCWLLNCDLDLDFFFLVKEFDVVGDSSFRVL